VGQASQKKSIIFLVEKSTMTPNGEEMHRTKKQQQRNKGKLTVLALALSGALAAMAPAHAQTTNSITSGFYTSTQSWANNDLGVDSGAFVSVAAATGVVATGPLGTLTNNGVINGLAGIVNIGGTIAALNNNSLINGLGPNAAGIYNNGGSITALTNGGTGTGTITGTIIGANYGIENAGAIGTLTNNGAINGATGIANITGVITALINNSGGSINGTGTATDSAGIYNNANTSITTLTNNSGGAISGHNGIFNDAGTITTLINGGAISGDSNGDGIFNGNESTISGTITTLTNGGVISGGSSGIDNGGAIGTLTNNGSISGFGQTGVSNEGTIDALINNSNSTISSGNSGVSNSGMISALTNSGTISGGNRGISNSGMIITLTNNSGGAISGGATGIVNNSGATISELTNNGTISSGGSGISNGGVISTLINNGIIGGSSGVVGIYNNGMISALTNSGMIAGADLAIYNDTNGSIGPITNSGVIAGSIVNLSSNGLSISGGAGTIVGTLTGFGSVSNIGGIGAGNIGTIDNESSDLAFTAGNLLLNDNINVTGHTVTNSGATLQVNNTITITGNYTQNAAATLQIGVADGAHATGTVSTDNGYGRLVVSGNATFDSGSTVTLQKLSTDTSYAFAQGQRYVVVQATNANAHYNDGSLNYSAIGYNGAVTGASVTDSDNSAKTDLVLTVGALNTAPPTNPSAPINSATDANAASSLTGLFHYTGTNAGMLNLFNAAAATGGTGDNGEANRAGAQLSPSSTGTALVQSVQVATQAVIDVTSAHIDMVRVAQASGSGDSGIATGERPGDVAVWGQAFGGQANQNDRSDASGYRADYNGMLIGADTALNDQWRAGGLFSYANTSIRDSGNSTGSSGHVNSYGLTGYAGYAGQKWYLDLSASAVQQKYSTFRNVDFTGFSGGASGSFNGMQYSASAQAGYPIKLDAATTLTPIAGVTYSRLNQDGYTESGSVAALQVDSSSTSSIKSDLGAKLERTFKTSYGDMTPLAQLSWRHEYRDTRLQSVGSFAADTTGTTSFTTQGVAPEKDTGVLVLGVTLARSQNLTLAAHYTLEAAGGYNAQTADVRLRYQF
jgi:outer membrane autotransporter protein